MDVIERKKMHMQKLHSALKFWLEKLICINILTHEKDCQLQINFFVQLSVEKISEFLKKKKNAPCVQEFWIEMVEKINQEVSTVESFVEFEYMYDV